MATRDDYIKRNRPVGNVPTPSESDEARHITPDEALDTAYHLEGVRWGEHGLTRDEIRRQYAQLPLGIYLRLPDSKRFTSPAEVLHEAGVAPSRAEGDFMGAHPDVPAEESVEDGGPPDWGEQPSVYPEGASIQSGSATDSDELLPGDNPDEGQVPGN